MKENVLDVLLYLFENYMYEEPEFNPDRQSLHVELAEAGFPYIEINKAFDWLDGLLSGELKLGLPESSDTIRVFAPREMAKLNCECRGFLLHLAQMQTLTPMYRERVIDRVMALESEQIDLEQLKWIVMMVLFNQPGNEAAYSWMEEMMLNPGLSKPH